MLETEKRCRYLLLAYCSGSGPRSMYFFDLGAEDLFVIEGLHADMASSDSRASLNKK